MGCPVANEVGPVASGKAFRVTHWSGRVRVDTGKEPLRPGSVVVWEGEAADLQAALAAAAQAPGAEGLPAFAPFRSR
jgi:hypothetical protein